MIKLMLPSEVEFVPAQPWPSNIGAVRGASGTICGFIGDDGALFEPVYDWSRIRGAKALPHDELTKKAWAVYSTRAVHYLYKTPKEIVTYRVGLLWAKYVTRRYLFSKDYSNKISLFLRYKFPILDTLADKSIKDFDSGRKIVVVWRLS